MRSHSPLREHDGVYPPAVDLGAVLLRTMDRIRELIPGACPVG